MVHLITNPFFIFHFIPKVSSNTDYVVSAAMVHLVDRIDCDFANTDNFNRTVFDVSNYIT